MAATYNDANFNGIINTTGRSYTDQCNHTRDQCQVIPTKKRVKKKRIHWAYRAQDGTKFQTLDLALAYGRQEGQPIMPKGERDYIWHPRLEGIPLGDYPEFLIRGHH